MERKYEVNEHFFDQESKAMWYILGISYAKCSPVKKTNAFRWQSSSKPLLDIVKSCLEAENPIKTLVFKPTSARPLTYKGYSLRIHDQNIYEALRNRGLDVPKKKRTFPEEIEEQYLDHFIRGIFDAQVSCANNVQREIHWGVERTYHKQVLYIGGFNTAFLQDLYDSLVKYAQVKGGKKVSNSNLELFGSDVKAVYDFLYRDREFIQENDSHLPFKKELFEVEYVIKNPPHLKKVKRAEKIERAKQMLLTGMSGASISKILGYQNPSGFFQAFRGETGMTTSDFLFESLKSLSNKS